MTIEKSRAGADESGRGAWLHADGAPLLLLVPFDPAHARSIAMLAAQAGEDTPATWIRRKITDLVAHGSVRLR
ncbi:MAG: hypothetical protein Q4F72_02805 [Desulfovibrionaceae bacterium]|nr:hypothetical protein [Desulfovibrionaceae bacterium]